jgi:hypothetical protein
MGVRCLLKYFALAASVQVGFLTFCVLVRYKSMFLYIYWPWVWLGEQLFGTGGAGGHAMAGAAILGGLLGFVAYSILASVILCRYQMRGRVP